MTHNELFSIIKNKKDWTHCKSGKLSAEWGTYEEDDIVYILFQKKLLKQKRINNNGNIYSE